MAETFSIEGLDYILGVLPKGSTTPATLYLGLWTGPGSASTVAGMSTAVLATSTGVTEATYTGYARQAITAASWGAVAAGAGAAVGGRQTTAGQVSFGAATAAVATPINGFFLATASTVGIGIFYANFDDTTAVPGVAIGDIIRVTPTFGVTP